LFIYSHYTPVLSHCQGVLKKNINIFLSHNSTTQRIDIFIDEELIHGAKNLLEYSNYSIGEIAVKMGFSDQFAFSHFFKRLCHTSPKAYRINIAEKTVE
jgi:AraC-like DNA-binding protein